MPEIELCCRELSAVFPGPVRWQWLGHAGNPSDEAVGRDIFCHDGSGRDETPPADGDAGQDGASTADHDLIFDVGSADRQHLTSRVTSRRSVIEKSGTRSDEDVVAQAGARRDVNVGHDANAVAEGDASLQRRMVADRAMVSSTNMGSNDRVVTRLKVVSERDIAVDQSANADDSVPPDGGGTAVGMILVADHRSWFDEGADADFGAGGRVLRSHGFKSSSSMLIPASARASPAGNA